MTILYYAQSCKDKTGLHYVGEYACEVSHPVAEMAMQRDPGKFMFYDDEDYGVLPPEYFRAGGSI